MQLLVAAGPLLLVLPAAMVAMLWTSRGRRRGRDADTLAMLHAGPDLMLLQGLDGVFLAYHTPAQGRWPLIPDTLPGRHMREALAPDLHERLAPIFERACHSDGPVVVEHTAEIDGADRRFEFRLVRCDNGNVLTIVRDVTERMRSEMALAEREQRYVAATAAGRAGVWDWNLETNTIYVDARLKALLGYADHEIPDTVEAWTARVHPDDLDRVLEDTQRYLEGETSAFEVEHRMLHQDGSVRWFVARGLVLREPGSPLRLVGTHTDVTERRQAEDAVRYAQAEMHRMSRLAAFGQFSASIAHEVSQPLTSIIMNARACLHWLSQVAGDVGEIRAGLLEIIDAGTRADAIIRNNRELFRDHIVAKRQLDVNDVIREVILLAAARLDQHAVAADTQLSDRLPGVLGDRVELGQVLLNLVFNAIDAMETVHPDARELVVTTHETDEGVQVSVRDRGIGLTGVDPQRLFTTGYTTKPSGTGIGLSVCKTIIEAHGGRIWVTPHPGAGTTFAFVLPVATVSAPARHAAAAAISTT